jgi:hypothetical protein
MFRVGQKVVCVDIDPNPGRRWAGDILRIDAIYTIVGFEEHVAGTALVLAEAKNCYRERMIWYRGYQSRRFRPVVDISHLEAIVREQMLGKPRVIAPDKFDRKRVGA